MCAHTTNPPVLAVRSLCRAPRRPSKSRKKTAVAQRSSYILWAASMRRGLGIEVLDCPRCQAGCHCRDAIGGVANVDNGNVPTPFVSEGFDTDKPRQSQPTRFRHHLNASSLRNPSKDIDSDANLKRRRTLCHVQQEYVLRLLFSDSGLSTPENVSESSLFWPVIPIHVQATSAAEYADSEPDTADEYRYVCTGGTLNECSGNRNWQTESHPNQYPYVGDAVQVHHGSAAHDESYSRNHRNHHE